jgi:hypothetical protein
MRNDLVNVRMILTVLKNVFQTDWCQIRILASGKQITAKLKFGTDLHNWFEFFKRKNKKYD